MLFINSLRILLLVMHCIIACLTVHVSFCCSLNSCCGVQEFQAELQKKEFEIAAVKTKVDDILKSHADDCPGYKELKKKKRRLGSSITTALMPSFLCCRLSCCY